MKRLSILSLLLGVTLMTGLILWQGIDVLTQLFAAAGSSILWIPVFYSLPLLCAAFSWQFLYAPGKAMPLSLNLYATWIGLSINWLLPVAQIGGELTRIRLLLQRQFALGPTIATVVVDQTLQLFTQALYTLLGLLLLALVQAGDRWLGAGALAGVLLIGALSGGFYGLQRRGLFGRLARLARRFLKRTPGVSLEANAAQVDAALQSLYRRRRRLAIAALWRLAFRIVMAGEVWLAAVFLGHSVSLSEALILESLGQVARSLAFAIPGGLGAQEGGFILMGSALGLPPQVALAVSLCKRFRELAIGVPGLLVWQWEEGRRALS